MARRPIAPVDTIWLNMDQPANLMVVESLMMLEAPVDRDLLSEVLRRRVVERYPVFHQRPVASRLPLKAPHWEDDEDFSVSRHLHHTVLPAPGGDAELQAYVEGHLGTPLPRDRPLWEVHVVDGYVGGSAIYSRFHHALADGIALTRVLLSLTDATSDHVEHELDGHRESAPSAVSEALSPAGAAVLMTARAATTVLDARRLLHPGVLGDAISLTRQTAGITSKLLLTQNPRTPVTGTPGVAKRVAWAPPLPLGPIAAAGHRTGTTINDLLVAALAGALATYVRTHDGVPVDIPTMVPVNLRPLDQPLPPSLGNRFALVLLTLPSGLATPFERLAETKRRMDAIKDSPEAALTFGLIQAIGRTGPELERGVVDFFAARASGVTTNVPGPKGPRYLCGTRITGMLGWAPESGRQTLGTAIFTYDDSVFVGFKVDASVVTDPRDLVRAFRAEVETLCRLGGTGPAPRTGLDVA